MRQEGPGGPRLLERLMGTRALSLGSGEAHEGQDQSQTRYPRKSGQRDGTGAQPPSKFSRTFPHPHHTLTCLVTKSALFIGVEVSSFIPKVAKEEVRHDVELSEGK